MPDEAAASGWFEEESSYVHPLLPTAFPGYGTPGYGTIVPRFMGRRPPALMPPFD